MPLKFNVAEQNAKSKSVGRRDERPVDLCSALRAHGRSRRDEDALRTVRHQSFLADFSLNLRQHSILIKAAYRPFRQVVISFFNQLHQQSYFSGFEATASGVETSNHSDILNSPASPVGRSALNYIWQKV